MKKFWKFTSLLAIALIVTFLIYAGGQAAGIWNKGEHTIEALWKFRGTNTEIAIGNGVDIDVESGGDVDVESGGEIEVESGGLIDTLSGGEIDINSGATLDVNGTINLTGSTITATGLITTTHISDNTDEWFSLNPCSAYIDGSGPISTSTTPALSSTAIDNIAAILYDGSDETTAVSWTQRIPSNMCVDGSGGLVVYLLVSTGTRSTNRTFSDLKVDWSIWVNKDGVAFDSSEFGQSTVTCGASSEMDRSNEVLTLTANSTAINGLSAGDWVTIEIFNASTSSLTGNEDDLEIKGGSVHAKFKR